MPIPANQVLVAEVKVLATYTGAGGSAKTPTVLFHYRRTGVTIGPNKANLAAAFEAGPYAAMLAAFNARWTNGVAYVRWLNDAQDPFVPFTLAGAGAIATDSSPVHDAVYMRLNSALRGKSYQGSKHFPGLNEADTTGDVLTGAGLARWQAVQTALLVPLAAAEGNTWNITVFSSKLSQARVNPTTILVNDVVTVVLDKSIGTMRRRKIATVI